MVERLFNTSDGVGIHYRKIVPKDKRAALVFIHGYVIHSKYYKEVIERFGQLGFLTLAPDLRGRGKSVIDDAKKLLATTTKRMVLDVRELLAHVSAEIGELRVYLAGASYGALVALRYTIDYGGIAGIVMAGPPFGKINAMNFALLQLIAQLNPKYKVPHADVFDYLKTKDLSKDPTILLEPMRAGAILDILNTIKLVEKDVGKLRVPMLMLYGTQDRLVTNNQISLIEKLKKGKDFTLESVEGMGHDMLDESSMQECIRLFSEWLAKREHVSRAEFGKVEKKHNAATTNAGA